MEKGLKDEGGKAEEGIKRKVSLAVLGLWLQGTSPPDQTEQEDNFYWENAWGE